MAQNQMVAPAASVVGFIVLIIGSMGYMGVFAASDVLCYVLMVAGLLLVVGGLAFMMYQNRRFVNTSEEE